MAMTKSKPSPKKVHYYTVALHIPGLWRPVLTHVNALSRTDAQRQARALRSHIGVQVQAPQTW
jgi:hypothetical protein